MGRVEQKEYPPLPDAQAKFARATFERFHVSVAGSCKARERRIDSCLDYAIQVLEIPHGGGTEDDLSVQCRNLLRSRSIGMSSPVSCFA